MGLENLDLDMPQSDASTPLVAVYMVTYNCEKYVAQAIEGIVQQQTSFPFHLFIGDDFSTDGTAVICRHYAEAYPSKITLILQPENKGAVNNARDVYTACIASGASYIAMCEGDDYWTDITKLQQQVDVLAANDHCSLCFHNANVLIEKTGRTEPFGSYRKELYTIEDAIALGAFISTVTIMFRVKGFVFPEWYFKIPLGDCSLLLMNALNGDFYCIDKPMAVYRKHDAGMSVNLEVKQDNMVYHYLELLGYFNQYTHYKFEKQVKQAGVKRLHDARTIVNYVNTSDTRPLHRKLFSSMFWKRKIIETLQ